MNYEYFISSLEIRTHMLGRNNLYTFQHSHRNELVATTLTTVWKTSTFSSLNLALTKKERKKEKIKN